MAYAEAQPTDSDSKKFMGVLVDTGAANEFIAIRGLNNSTVHSEKLADMCVIASRIEKAEDAVHSGGDYGVMALAVRKDAPTALAGSDGDYAPLEIDALARLHSVNWSPSKLVNLTTAAPNPSGNDVTMFATGAAPQSTDLQVRDANVHGFVIPMAGYRELSIGILSITYDKDLTVSIYAEYAATGWTGLHGGLLATFSVTNGLAPFVITIGSGGAVGQGGSTGGAAANAAQLYYDVPAMRAAVPYINISISAATPTSGAHELYIARRA